LLDALSQAGVHYLSEAAFVLGVPRIVEFERAIKQSRRTLLVLSPAYLIDTFNQFTDLLAQSYGLETATWPVIPLILQRAELPARLAMLTALDMTDTAHQAAAIEQRQSQASSRISVIRSRSSCSASRTIRRMIAPAGSTA